MLKQSMRAMMAGGVMLAWAAGLAPAFAEDSYTVEGFSVEGSVSATDASADGAHVLFAGTDGTTRILDTGSKQEQAAISWPGVIVHTASFSPDGASVLLFAPDKGAGIWDAATGRNRVMLSSPEMLNGLSWSGDGKLLAGPGTSGTLHIFDALTGKETASIATSGENPILRTKLGPGNAALLALSDHTVEVFDVKTGKPGLRVSRDSRINAAAWSPDGARIVLALNDDTAEIIDAGNGAVAVTLRGHADDVLDAAFSPDGMRLVTGSEDDTAKLWSADGTLLATLPGHYNEVAAVVFTADGQRVITLANDARVRIWSPVAAGAAPDGAEGLWRYAFDTDEELPDEITRVGCMTQPTVVGKQGLVVMFDMVGDNEPPQPVQTLRCTAAGACKMFPGAPGQSQEPSGDATFSLKDGRASICNGEQCVTLDRCKAMAWTEEEKTSGYAARWEDAVLGSIKDN